MSLSWDVLTASYSIYFTSASLLWTAAWKHTHPLAIMTINSSTGPENTVSAEASTTPAPAPAPAGAAYLYGLHSGWPAARDLAGSDGPCRVQGELADLIVYGTIPKEIDGTFYRVMCDPYVPPHVNNVPLDGDGSISAFRFHDGRVDMKLRYIETERFKLERKANQALFGIYRNPFTHHPCVRAAVDSTANTNLVFVSLATMRASMRECIR